MRVICFVRSALYSEGVMEENGKVLAWRFDNGEAKVIPLTPLDGSEYGKFITGLYEYLQVENN